MFLFEPNRSRFFPSRKPRAEFRWTSGSSGLSIISETKVSMEPTCVDRCWNEFRFTCGQQMFSSSNKHGKAWSLICICQTLCFLSSPSGVQTNWKKTMGFHTVPSLQKSYHVPHPSVLFVYIKRLLVANGSTVADHSSKTWRLWLWIYSICFESLTLTNNNFINALNTSHFAEAKPAPNPHLLKTKNNFLPLCALHEHQLTSVNIWANLVSLCLVNFFFERKPQGKRPPHRPSASGRTKGFP